jgi:prepilin-type N-terminal cleavage/methylation domain-containing protein
MTSRSARRGMSLLEVMVVMAILLVMTAILVPAGRSVFQLEQRGAARKLATVFERFHDEAVMRNRSYRVTFYLDENRYVIESGEAGALVAASPEDRERFEAATLEKLQYMSEEEQKAFLHRERQPFESMEAAGKMEIELPGGVRLGGVYTPQYGHVVVPGEKLEGMEGDEDSKLRVQSYIMNNGFSEHTIVWIVDADDPEDGWTVEVEPLSGVVRLHGDLIDPRDGFAWVPEDGPSLQ